MDTDEKALLAAIISQPDEDTLRLIYADWLQEHDQPERADYIRLSIQLANLRYGEPDFEVNQARLLEQRRPLIERHYENWQSEFAAQFPANRDLSFTFERGFVEHVRCSPTYFLDNAEELFRRAPIRWLLPRNLTATTARQLSRSSYLQRLSGFRLIDARSVGVLLECPVVKIAALNCSYRFMAGMAARVALWQPLAIRLASHAGLKLLKQINFDSCQIGDGGGQALADSMTLAPDVLSLLGTELSESVRRALRARYGSRVWLDEADRNGFPRRF